jgi:hypothetical protein
MNEITYIKISVQNDSGVANKMLLHVGDVTLFSTTASDEELERIFDVSIDEDKNNTNTQIASSTSTLVLLFFGISAIAVVSVFVWMRSTGDESGE